MSESTRQIKLKKLHPAQLQILAEAKRFNVLKCGRRFGKTELTKELSIQPMVENKTVGYWTPTYKDLYEVWNELKFTLFDVISHVDQQVKQITLITGGKIDMWSLEDPNSGRGRRYHRVIIDEAEKARNLKPAWEQTIRATLVDFKGDAWFMSTPKFGQTYFKQTLFNNQDHYDNWKSWRFTSFDNPFLDPLEIEEAKKYDELTYRCEYLAEDVDISQNPFAYCFDEEKHVGACDFNPEHELMLSFDFNVSPITCISAQHIDGQLRVIKSFKINNSNIYDLCDKIITDYGHHNPLYLVTGDATGRARSAMTVGNINYYTVIKNKLEISDNQIKVAKVNPAISDSQVLLNSLLSNYSVLIDKENCQPLIYDLKYVEVDTDGSIKKDRTSEAKMSDQLDCMRYLCNTFFRWFIKSQAKSVDVEYNDEEF